CTTTATAAITEPAALVATAVVDSNVTCNGSANGGATVSASGGSTPYNFTWGNSALTPSITGVAAGSYTVTVTDNSGCMAVDTVTVTEPALLTAHIDSVLDVTCVGDSNGAVYASASGGVSPYGFAWSDGSLTNVATP